MKRLLQKFGSVTLIILLFSITSGNTVAQDMYNALMRQHGKYRAGLGFQLSEPTGIVLNLLKGEFCSNDALYGSNIVWELYAGRENAVFASQKEFRDGTWTKGGWHVGAGGFLRLWRYTGSYATFQVMPGAGLQYGKRRYEDAVFVEQETDAFGINFSLRTEWTPQGVTINNNLFFLTLFTDLKYHNQFGEKFSYLRPNIGLTVRKVR